MFNVYNDHGRSHLKLLPVDSLADALELAVIAAGKGQSAFYRVFEITDGPTGERFVMAFSVLNGRATPWLDVTFPKAHW